MTATSTTLDAVRPISAVPADPARSFERGSRDASPAASYRAEWRPLASLAAIATPWRNLAARALEPNVFYEPAFALAAAPVFGRDAGAILLWSQADHDRLVGLFPARIERRRYGVPFSVLVGWTHPYAPLGVPLVDRDVAASVIEAAFDFLAAEPGLPDLLLLPLTPADGPFATALGIALLARRGRLAAFGRHRRALLAPPRSRADYLVRSLSPRKRKELRRQTRRLAEHGVLSTVSATAPADVAAALDDFLRLEAEGWKGRADTAARLDDGAYAFMQAAVGGLAAVNQVQVDRLFVGGRAIAAAIALRSGRSAWFWKIAYDETLARSSPGVQLTLELTRTLLRDPSISRADSCATPDHAMIDHIWRERLALADHMTASGPAAAKRFALGCHLESARRSAIGFAKQLRRRIRGR